MRRERVPEDEHICPVLGVEDLLVQVGEVEVDDNIVEKLALLKAHVITYNQVKRNEDLQYEDHGSADNCMPFKNDRNRKGLISRP